MMEYNELKKLAVALAKADASAPVAYSFGDTKYSYNALQDTLRDEINAFAGDFYGFEQNKMTVYKLMAETIDEIFPKRVEDRYMMFAETKVEQQGNKPIFKQKTGKTRAKKNFITRVGLAGLYEVFKLGTKEIEVPMGAIGGAAQIGLEEWLDKRVDFNDLMEVLLEGMDEAVYKEVSKALTTMVASFGQYNKVVTNEFNERKFDHLLATAEAYGPVTIYTTFEFAAQMFPTNSNWISEEMKNERWRNGYITSYKGRRVVILPQSVTDDNAEKVIDPTWAYLFPGDAKPIKIAFEGQTIVDEFKNYDRSREIQMYKKFGIVAITNPGLCAYQNTSLYFNDGVGVDDTNKMSNAFWDGEKYKNALGADATNPVYTSAKLTNGADEPVSTKIVNGTTDPVNTAVTNSTTNPVNTKEVTG